jgi:hypothetical protein
MSALTMLSSLWEAHLSRCLPSGSLKDAILGQLGSVHIRQRTLTMPSSLWGAHLSARLLPPGWPKDAALSQPDAVHFWQ